MANSEKFLDLTWKYCGVPAFKRVASFSHQSTNPGDFEIFLKNQRQNFQQSGFWTHETDREFEILRKSFVRDMLLDEYLESYCKVLSLCHGDDFFANLHKLFKTSEQSELLELFAIENFWFYQWVVTQMIENLSEEIGTTFILKEGSGLFAYALLDACYFSPTKIRNFDEHQQYEEYSELLLKRLVIAGWFFKAGTFDPCEKEFGLTEWTANVRSGSLQFAKTEPMYEEANTIVNLACDNMTDFHKWYDSVHAGKLLVLVSSNNPDSKMPLSNIDEFNGRTPKTNLIHQDEYQFGDYSKYLLIFEK